MKPAIVNLLFLLAGVIIGARGMLDFNRKWLVRAEREMVK